MCRTKRSYVIGLICLAGVLTSMAGCLLQGPPAPVPLVQKLDLEMLKNRYRAKLEPNGGAKCEVLKLPGMNTKELRFVSVERGEGHMSVVLNELARDVMDMVKEHGGELRGPVRESKVNGVVHGFEFEYHHSGQINGFVRGEIKTRRNQHWDLEVVVKESHPR